MKSQNNFTLMELLVVVAIIGILLAILQPSLIKVRQELKSSVCMSNLNQQGLAASLYSLDNDRNYIISTPKKWWSRVLWDEGYLPANENVMTCPSLPNEGWSNNWRKIYGVALDQGVGQRPGWKKVLSNRRVHLPSVESPSEFFHYGDSAKNQQQWLFFYWSSYTIEQDIHTRHSGAANLWFIDGHVQRLKSGSLKKLGFVDGLTENHVLIPY